MVDFSQISSTLNRPGTRIEFDFTGGLPGLPRPAAKVLLAGAKLAGTAAAATLYRVLSEDHAKTLFGVGSQIAGMAKGWFEANRNRDIQVYGIGLADAGGAAAATGTFTYTGPATSSGTLSELVCGQAVKVGVTSGMTATQAATAVAAAINAYADLPVTAASAAGVVTVTARNKGPEGNGLWLAHNHGDLDATPAGMTCAVAAMSGGTTNPDASSIIAAIGTQPFMAIVQPWTDDTNLTFWEACMAGRADANFMNYGIVYTHSPAGFAGLTTLAALRNSTYAPVTGLAAIPEPSWQVAATVAAVNVQQQLDDPSRPVKTLVLPGISAPRINLRFHDDDREALLASGIATLTVNAAGQVVIERMITTYKTNAAGFVDRKLKELTKILTYYAMSWSQQARLDMKFPRYKLADDGNDYLPDAHTVTPSVVKGELIALAGDWYEAGWIQNLDQYIADMVVVRDLDDEDRVNSLQRPSVPPPLNNIATVIQPVN